MSSSPSSLWTEDGILVKLIRKKQCEERLPRFLSLTDVLWCTRMTVPPRAIHTFKNASALEPAEFFMTATPGRFSNPPHAYLVLFD